MPRVGSRLIERIEVAEGTVAFAFDRPAGFDFTAGQFLIIVLPDPPYDDAEGNRRVFSIASPPQATGKLQIATRMTGSALKRSLAEVTLGAPVELSGPSGSFTLHTDSSVPTVFIAGGIGITPFRSMVHDAVNRRLPHQITLIYSNRTPEGAAFHGEFSRIAETHAHFKYIPTMTQAEKSRQSWDGERRYVNAEFLRDHIGDVTTPAFYLAGPPGLVAGIAKAVIEAGADPAHIRSEEFAGY
jgi:ferredoxin-NADP reductase